MKDEIYIYEDTETIQSSGELDYVVDMDFRKVVLKIDPEIVRYYRWFIPKNMVSSRQLHSSHISVVRKETVINLDVWGKHQGRIVNFEYSPIIYNSETYCWINAYSKELEIIRGELGLPISVPWRRTLHLDYSWVFHITLGNYKSNQN